MASLHLRDSDWIGGLHDVTFLPTPLRIFITPRTRFGETTDKETISVNPE